MSSYSLSLSAKALTSATNPLGTDFPKSDAQFGSCAAISTVPHSLSLPRVNTGDFRWAVPIVMLR